MIAISRKDSDSGGAGSRARRWTFVLCILGLWLGSAACSKAPSAPPAPPIPDVEVATVEQKDISVYGEWIGSLDGMVNAEIKPQVTGYLLKKHYTEGSFVKEGELLFEIDPRSFQAALDQSKGQLAQAKSQLVEADAQVGRAEATKGKTQHDVDRYTALVKDKVISSQDFDTAVQANLGATADLGAAKARVETAKAAIVAAEAAVRTAELNLAFTRIVSPIDGIAGLALAQIGNLVSPTGPSLTTVSTLDPIKAYFTVSEQEYMRYTRDYPSETQRLERQQQVELELVLADGSVHPHKGKFFMADREVNGQTGTIRLAGLFPNPGNILRPGQYARIRAVTAVKKSALLVPQRAVADLQGSYQVAVVDGENKVDMRPVKVGERSGSMWIIEEGLKLGERVIVEGTQKARPGATVNPKPFAAPAAPQGK